MQKDTLNYIKSRANESENSSIKAVSCPDIRALLEERAELLTSLQILMDALSRGSDTVAVTVAKKNARSAIAKAAA